MSSASGLYTNNAYVNTTKEAIALGFTGKGEYYMSDYFVRNASFIRCDNITLGYSFKKTYSGHRPIKEWAAVYLLPYRTRSLSLNTKDSIQKSKVV